MAEVHLTRRALFDIDAIDRYSIKTFGERVAAQYLSDIYAGAARPGERPTLLQEHPGTSLRLRFYRVREHVLSDSTGGGGEGRLAAVSLRVRRAARRQGHRPQALSPDRRDP